MAKKPKYKKKTETKKKQGMAWTDSPEAMILAQYMVGGVAKEHDVRQIYILDTGILDLNLAVGTNGLYGGRMSLTWGEKASAKTLLLMCMIAQCQRDGGSAAFLDPEGTFDGPFARMLGVNTDKLFLVSAQEKRLDPKTKTPLLPLSGEEWFDIANMLIFSGRYHFVGMDSITACIPYAMLNRPTINQAELKGAQANMLSLMLQKTNSFLTTSPHCHFAMIAQSRDVPMQMGPATKKPTGGNAPGFYISYEIQVKKKNVYREKLPIAEGVKLAIDQDVAIDLELLIRKNKVARIYEPAQVYVDLRTGVCQATDVVKTAVKLGVIEQRSSHFYYGDWNWNGETAVVTSLRERNDLYEHVRKTCIDTLGMKFTDLESTINAADAEVPEYGSEEFDEKMKDFKENIEANMASDEVEEDEDEGEDGEDAEDESGDEGYDPRGEE